MGRWAKPAVSKPAHYAQTVLMECGLKEPPIPVEPILDHLKLGLKEFSVQDFPPEQHQVLQAVTKDACAFKMPVNGQTTVWVRGDLALPRKRMSILHECGHEIVPWHKGVNYFCKEEDLYPEAQKLIEREAFNCATELLMPSRSFFDDLSSLEFGIFAIEQLSLRYGASLEAAAIRYAKIHSGACAVVMAEPAREPKGQGNLLNPMNTELELELSTPTIAEQEVVNKLVVKYCVKSKIFPSYIQPGTEINQNSRIYSAWMRGQPLCDVIPASTLGSSQQINYHIECLPLMYPSKILILIWIPAGRQEILF
jgi:Zn-dependent peptidase ImmA (M78 family)